VRTGIAKSNREAREHIGQGAISINGVRADAERRVGPSDVLAGDLTLVRRGKKSWNVVRWLG
jgi:tyrosyl-tRNA synthetase